MSTTDVHLTWPPPGLEPMRGRAHALARRFAIADVLIVGALAGLSLSEAPSGAQGSGPALVFLVLALLGSFVLVNAAFGIWRAAREGGTNVWRGYTWVTIAEVCADPDGNTGALINGTGEFAQLSAETRNGLRVARLARSFMRLLAGALPLPVILILGVTGVGDLPGMTLTLAIVLAPSALLLAFASVSGSAEQIALRPVREDYRRRFDRRADAVRISEAWYTAFEGARQGQTMGRGPAGGVVRAWALGGVASVVVIGAVVVMIPVWVLAALGSGGEFGRTTVFTRSTQPLQYAYLRAFTPRVDSTITPERAGEAFHAIDERGAQRRPAYVKPPVRTYPSFPALTPALFPGLTRTSASFPGAPVLMLAKKGFTPAQRAYAAEVAGNPIWKDFGVVARAARADFAAGTYITPFPADLSPAELRRPSFAYTRDLAYASTVRAASYLVDGRAAEAENALRETIAFGFRMIDDGNTAFDPLIGASMIGSAGDALANLYQLTGNPEGPRLRALAERPTREVSSSADHQLWDPLAPRAVRIAAMQASALRACGSVHGLLFGPPASEQRMVKSLRSQIARTPAEQALFDLDAQILDRPRTIVARTSSVAGSLLLFGARISGAVFHAPRIPNCVAAMPGVSRVAF